MSPVYNFVKKHGKPWWWGRRTINRRKAWYDRFSENKALILRAYEEIWNQGNLDSIDEIVAPDCRAYSPQNPNDPVSIEAAREEVAAARAAFPDLTRTAEELVAEGDRVTVRFRITSTQRGEFCGLPPTGKEIELYAITVYGIENGKIAYEWTISDSLGLMQQLGASS